MILFTPSPIFVCFLKRDKSDESNFLTIRTTGEWGAAASLDDRCSKGYRRDSSSFFYVSLKNRHHSGFIVKWRQTRRFDTLNQSCGLVLNIRRREMRVATFVTENRDAFSVHCIVGSVFYTFLLRWDEINGIWTDNISTNRPIIEISGIRRHFHSRFFGETCENSQKVDFVIKNSLLKWSGSGSDANNL